MDNTCQAKYNIAGTVQYKGTYSLLPQVNFLAYFKIFVTTTNTNVLCGQQSPTEAKYISCWHFTIKVNHIMACCLQVTFIACCNNFVSNSNTNIMSTTTAKQNSCRSCTIKVHKSHYSLFPSGGVFSLLQIFLQIPISLSFWSNINYSEGGSHYSLFHSG